MTLRRMNDYVAIIIYVSTIIFVAGGGWVKIDTIQSTLDDHKSAMSIHNTQEKEQDLQIKQLQIEAENRDKFYKLMQELLKETKDNNKETFNKIQQINETVVDTKYKVESIERRLPKP